MSEIDPIKHYWLGLKTAIERNDLSMALFYISRILAKTDSFQTELPVIEIN